MEAKEQTKGKGLFRWLKEGLAKTRRGLQKHLGALFAGGRVDAETLEELEAVLIGADFGVGPTQRMLEEIKGSLKGAAKEDPAAWRQALKEAVLHRLQQHDSPWAVSPARPHVILMVGVNGVGKTTTCGKLAYQLARAGHAVMLAAGDTFRAAAVEQLKIWGTRANCPVISQGQEADAASVVFDAHAAARSRSCDVLLADTAGRLHTKVNLMEELKKIQRVLTRQDPEAPQDVWLVLDATTGQNAISQARLFHQALGLTGLIITKLDGTAKGGVVVGIAEELALPVRFIGVGEGVEDLRAFDANAFVEALFEE